MKQILFLFFTLYGINAAFAQDAVPALRSDIAASIITIKKDSLVKKTYSAKLLSNPVNNKAELEVKGFEAGQVQLLMTDNKGNRVRDDRRLLFGKNDVVTIMFSLQAGVYFIIIKQKEKQVSTKVIVR